MLALLLWFVPDYQTRQLSATGTSPHAGRQDAIGAVVRATVREDALVADRVVGQRRQRDAVGADRDDAELAAEFLRPGAPVADRASGAMTAVVVIAFSIGAVVWGRLIDRIGSRDPRHRIPRDGMAVC